MDKISTEESKFLYRIYEEVVAGYNSHLRWNYLKGPRDELSTSRDEIYSSKLGDLNVQVSNRAVTNAVSLIIRSDEGTLLYEGSDHASIKMIYTYLSRRREGEENQKREQEKKERCAPLEQLLAALEKPAKKKAGRRK